MEDEIQKRTELGSWFATLSLEDMEGLRAAFEQGKDEKRYKDRE